MLKNSAIAESPIMFFFLHFETTSTLFHKHFKLQKWLNRFDKDIHVTPYG